MSGQLVVDQVHGEAELGLVQQTVPVSVRQGPHLVHTTKYFCATTKIFSTLARTVLGRLDCSMTGLTWAPVSLPSWGPAALNMALHLHRVDM